MIKSKLGNGNRWCLEVKNEGNVRFVLEAPTLEFRKGMTVRRFKLKGDGTQNYPIQLPEGQKHELQVNLDVFYKHDPALRSYWLARVHLKTSDGSSFSTSSVILSQNLFRR